MRYKNRPKAKDGKPIYTLHRWLYLDSDWGKVNYFDCLIEAEKYAKENYPNSDTRVTVAY